VHVAQRGVRHLSGVEQRGSLANSRSLACLLVSEDVGPESPWCVRTGTGENKTNLLFTLPSGFGC